MRSPSFHLGWFSLVAAFGLSACGGGHDELTKRLAAMQGDLTRLQSHSDRLEQRLEALEMRKEAPPAPRVATSDSSASGERPRLLVVKLEPGDTEREATPSADAPTATLRPEDSAADTSPRPMIRVYGSRTDVDPGSDSPKRKR
ncbi:MAG: hypothetical protein ABUL62_18345 [Myxococcales bacterium]|jgi:hypothetical protein